jgi:probable HAF family extracellular repeat protein
MLGYSVPLILIVIATLPGVPAVAAPWFQGLKSLVGSELPSATAYAVSADGRVIVGGAGDLSQSQAFYWSEGTGGVGIGDLPGGATQALAQGVSADGSVIVGYSTSDRGVEAFRWTQADGMLGLGDLAGGVFESWAIDVSADGGVIVGFGNSGAASTEREAFLWTAADGMLGLGTLSGDRESGANGISADGSVVAGISSGAGDYEATVWTEDSGLIGLGAFPGSTRQFTQAWAISDDGVVVVGNAYTPEGVEATRWTQASGFVALGDFEGGTLSSQAQATNADGSVIVGSGRAEETNLAFIWTEADGFRAVQDVLASEYGLDLTGWTLQHAFDVSADGRTIVGIGTNPDGDTEGWIAVIPEPSAGLLFGLGLGVLSCRRRSR